MREGPLQTFAAQAPRATDAPPIAIHRGTRLRRLLPVAPSAIGFRDVAPDTHGFKIYERLIAVTALVADDLLQAVALGPDRFDLLGRGDQRFDTRLHVAAIGVLRGYPDDRAALEIDGMLGFVGQVRAPVLHLRDLRIMIMRMDPMVVRALLLPLAIKARQVGARRRLNARGLRELRQEVLIALARVPPHDAAQRRVRLQGPRAPPPPDSLRRFAADNMCGCRTRPTASF